MIFRNTKPKTVTLWKMKKCSLPTKPKLWTSPGRHFIGTNSNFAKDVTDDLRIPLFSETLW